MNTMKNNLADIQEKITAAALRAGRNPDHIKLVAVSKRINTEKIMAAVACGQTHFGENFIQEADEKAEILSTTELGQKIKWHYIGHLQSNKAKTAARLFHTIETIDRIKTAKIINNSLEEMDRFIDIFVQVNIGKEPQKSGVLPDDCEILLGQLKEQCPRLKVQGLMTMPPYYENPEKVRPYFREMKLLAQSLSGKNLFLNEQIELSMGMSGDFEVAIEEGATQVRVGTALFGERG